MPEENPTALPFSNSMSSESHFGEDPGWPGTTTRRCPTIATADAVVSIPLFETVNRQAECPYCGTPLRLEEDFEWSDSHGTGTIDVHVSTGRAQQCPHCQWWVYQHYDENRFMNRSSVSLKTEQGIVFAFDVMSDYKAPLGILRQQILTGNIDLCQITPRNLELLVGSVLKDLFRCKVVHVGGPGDGGADLMLVEADKPCLVQVKRRADPKKTEGVSLVRHVLGSMLLLGTKEGIIVSTASGFSRPAKEAADRALEVCGFHVTLYNQQRLREALALTAPPGRPWRQQIPKAWLEGNVRVFSGGKKDGLAGFDRGRWHW